MSEAPLNSDETLQAEIVETRKALDTVSKGLVQLEKVIEQHYTPEKIEQLVTDLCHANDVRRDKNGDEYRTPNWEARKNGLNYVLSLLRYTKKDATPVDQAATKIVFQIVNNPSAPAIAKKEEPQ